MSNKRQSEGIGNSLLFSIIVPVHNAQHTLERCVCSVTKQAFSDWELLLVENGSSDNSVELCQSFAANDSRIHVLRSQTGPSEARNAGIAAAKGKYILFLDADDCFSGSLAHLASGMKRETDLYVYQCECQLSNGRIAPSFYTLDPDRLDGADGPNAYRYLFGELRVPGSPWLYAFLRSMVINNALQFPQELSLGEDLCFVTRAVWYAKRVQFVPETLVCFTQNDEESLSSHITAESFDALWKAAQIGMDIAKPLSPERREQFLFPYRNSILWLLCKTGKLPKGALQINKRTFRKLALFLRTGKAPRHVLIGWLCTLLGRNRAAWAAVKVQTLKNNKALQHIVPL